jgi:hypothetical protein
MAVGWSLPSHFQAVAQNSCSLQQSGSVLSHQHEHLQHRSIEIVNMAEAANDVSWNPRTCIAALQFIPIQIMRAQQPVPKMQ